MTFRRRKVKRYEKAGDLFFMFLEIGSIVIFTVLGNKLVPNKRNNLNLRIDLTEVLKSIYC